MIDDNTAGPAPAESVSAEADPARGPHIFDFKGRAIHILDPRPEDVHPDVITHSLALQCRYGGHCPRFLSVAEHSLLVAELVAREHPELALAALLHDAAEAYVGDIVAPLKRLLWTNFSESDLSYGPEGVTIGNGLVPLRFHALETRWDSRIRQRFGLMLEGQDPEGVRREAEIVHAADLAVGAAEMLSFGWSGPTPGRESAPAEGITIRHLRPEAAGKEFLWALWRLLSPEQREALAFETPLKPRRDLFKEAVRLGLAQRAEESGSGS